MVSHTVPYTLYLIPYTLYLIPLPYYTLYLTPLPYYPLYLTPYTPPRPGLALNFEIMESFFRSKLGWERLKSEGDGGKGDKGDKGEVGGGRG